MLRHFVKVAGLGAFAFFPLGDERDHRFEKCQAGRDIFDIAARATDPDRSKRYDRAYGRIVPWIETRQTRGTAILKDSPACPNSISLEAGAT